MKTLITWLGNFAVKFIDMLYNGLIDLIQVVSDSLADFCVFIVSMFPTGSGIPESVSAPSSAAFTMFIQCLNWIAPVQFMVSLVVWLTSGMLLYVAIAPLARWAKLLN